MSIDPARIEVFNGDALRREGRYVLYWMTAQRRTRYNLALERAVSLCNELERPLLVLEAIRVDYRWATARSHRFVLDGMLDNRARFLRAGVTYHAYVERERGEGHGLVEALGADACVVVTDDYPCFFLRGLPERAAARVSVRLEAVDANGLLPMRSTTRAFPTAHSFRRHLQRELSRHLELLPDPEPLEELRVRARAKIPVAVTSCWPEATEAMLSSSRALDRLPLEHDVSPLPLVGGHTMAKAELDRFVASRLDGYGDRNHPDRDIGSGLSPWLHFGHISSAEILIAIAEREGWTPDLVAPAASGARFGWWGMSEAAEGFLDQLVTWRELGFNMCVHRDDYDAYTSLPDWAQRTLSEHEADPRPHRYDRAALDAADTHDAVWNAAQRQLVREGRIHNYLRMLWGKKILEWSATPRAALDHMIHLNNRYALDGRDPNSYSGIFWVLGRYDRAWGPERPIFGKIRYMSSDNARRKLKLRSYLDRYAA